MVRVYRCFLTASTSVDIVRCFAGLRQRAAYFARVFVAFVVVETDGVKTLTDFGRQHESIAQPQPPAHKPRASGDDINGYK